MIAPVSYTHLDVYTRQGFYGAVPAAFGVVIYYFAQYAKEARATILLGEDADFQGYSYIVNGMMKDKAMLLAIIAFVVIVMVTALIHQLNFDYAWYVAIGVGSVFTILVFMVCGMLVDVKMCIRDRSQFILKSVKREDIVLKSEGTQEFSYAYVADCVAGILAVMLDGKDGEAYNICCLLYTSRCV